METELLNNTDQLTDQLLPEVPVRNNFIMANTEDASLHDLQHKHIIPVYVKDNEPLIGHYDFIKRVYEVAGHVYGYEDVAEPVARVSHPIKGRIPEARNKPAGELLESEKTLYYERMMFLIEIPAYSDEVGGNKLTLTVGGVKAYNLDSLYSRKGSPEHFKVFVGYKNYVCTNLCVSTDGLLTDIRVTSLQELQDQVYEMLTQYKSMEHLEVMRSLVNYELSDKQFAQLIGRCRLYQYLNQLQRKDIHPLQFGDQQISAVCKDYYRDKSFCRAENGSINLWKLYNLFTGVNKSSYIDSFLERSANAGQFVLEIQQSLDGKGSNWFLQ